MIARLAIGIGLAIACVTQVCTAAPLALEGIIPLPNTSGRIDHMAVDVARKRLFVVELGNGSVDVVDIASRTVVHRISGLDEPQGVAYAAKPDVLVVACGGDGVVRFFDGKDYAPRGVIKLGDDADNAHLDPRNGRVVVGYGSGGLAVIDPAKGAKQSDIPLPAHPEGFIVSAVNGRAYVNVPDADAIEIVDLDAGKPLTKWTLPQHWSSNFPIALDDSGHVAAVFRSPSKLALFDEGRGQLTAAADTCSDADDVFFDIKRKRLYVSCGQGVVDIFPWNGKNLGPLERVSTSSGARTSLFVSEFDRLIVAARAGLLGSSAAIQIYRPLP
ncbi:MAG: hypothetical protein KGJ78_14325 [Alphaproteobacteria bacterium]|nr:hypothetical protein [Alphaproteobacteria bacterium]